MESKTTIAVLEERMNTKQAEYKTDIAHLRAEIINAIGQLREDSKTDIGQLREDRKGDIAQLRKDMAQQEIRLILVFLGILGFAVALLKFD